METLLEGEFGLYNQRNFTSKVVLTTKFLKYQSLKLGSNCLSNVKRHRLTEETLPVIEIIGCDCKKPDASNEQHIAYFTIYAYPLLGKRNSKRVKKSVTFAISQSNLFEENMAIANEWRTILYSLLYSSVSSYTNEGDFDLQFPLYCNKKKVLVFINPTSGTGVALEIYKSKVNPVLLEAEISHELIITSYSHHAYVEIQSINLSEFTGIIVIAGDGLLHEVYNGLLQRSDRDLALSIPIGIIPGGSGNGLARSMAYHTKEDYHSNPVLISTLSVINPVSSPMDLVLINTESGKNYISFLSIGYGIMSDIDIESERFRAIGEARFTLYAFIKILNLQKYRTRLSFKNTKMGPNQFRKFCGESKNFRHGGYKGNNAILPFEEDSNYQSGNLSCAQSTRSDVAIALGDPFLLQNNSLEIPIEAETLDAIANPLSDDWITIEDDFVSIYAVSQPFIGSDKFMSPKSKLNDGLMWLSYVKCNFTKTSIIKYLLAITDGKHINMPGVTYIPVTDLRIEPLCSHGNITIDGELIDLSTIQATVLPGKGCVMTRKT